MILFHGTRAVFHTFENDFVFSGEGAGAGYGMYFVDNLRGAANHARQYCRNGTNSYVYVCRLEKATPINIYKAISKQSEETRRIWSLLPVSVSCFEHEENWFEHSAFLRGKSESEKLKYLHGKGFHVVVDADGIFTDAYLYGIVYLVLDVTKIEILEVIDTRDINYSNDAEFQKQLTIKHESISRV